MRDSRDTCRNGAERFLCRRDFLLGIGGGISVLALEPVLNETRQPKLSPSKRIPRRNIDLPDRFFLKVSDR